MQLIACFGGILICALEIVSHNYHSLSAQNPFRAEDFCSIIIETRYRKPPKAHRSPRDVVY